jgi:hypothetical protein
VSDEFVLDDETAKSTDGGTLRQKLEQAIAALNAMKQENESLKSEKAERVVKATWDELQVPSPIRSFYQGDKSPDAMKQWWEASKGFFNIQAADEQPKPQELTPEQAVEQAAAQAFQQASGLGTDALTGGYDAAMAKAKDARGKTGADREAALKAFYAAGQVPDYN